MFDRILPTPISRNALSRAATLAGLAAVFVIAATSSASAQSACLPHGKLVDLLDGRYSEQRVAVGLESNGRLFEVAASSPPAWNGRNRKRWSSNRRCEEAGARRLLRERSMNFAALSAMVPLLSVFILSERK
jgi:hypothetical protein